MSWSEEKYDEYVRVMEDTFPTMFSEGYGGFAIGEGWWGLVKELCEEIDHHMRWKQKNGHDVEPVIVRQIKEKFGGLRFYYDGGDDYVSGLVTMAERWAAHTCEECGEAGRHRSGGWVRTLCDKHEAERQERMKD